MANCELLSENAYTRVNELIDHVDWTHFTAYVRLKFYCSCIWGLKGMHNSFFFLVIPKNQALDERTLYFPK